MTSCLDTVFGKQPCALSSSSATHCAVRTPETEVVLMTLASTLAKESTSAITHGLVSGSRFRAPVVASRRSTLTARQLLNSPSSCAPSPSNFHS